MPQEEKFITRKQGGIGYQDTDYTQTQKGMKANSGAYRKATGPSYNRLMSLDRERRADRAGFDPFEMGKARDAFDKASSNAYPKQYAAEEKATNRAVTARDATNARIARERLASRATAAGNPQPFITRKDAGIREGSRDPLAVRQRKETADTPSGRKAQKIGYARVNEVGRKVIEKHGGQFTDAYRADMSKTDPTVKRLRAQTANNVRLARSGDVTARDAANAANARGRLAARASSANAQPKGGGMMAKAAALGPVAEGAAALYAADEATGFRRTKYSGNSGGPSFSMNPYASSNKSSYAGQSAMSKAMGVGKKK